MLSPAAAVAAVAGGSGGGSTRHRAIGLYKELLRLGRDYPDPAYGFERRVRESFRRNLTLTSPTEIDQKLALAAHIRDETVALIGLAKYRYLRRTYIASAELGMADPFATATAAVAASQGAAGPKAGGEA